MNDRVYVSKEEWDKLRREAQLELIALSNMDSDQVLSGFSHKEHKEEYEKIMEI